MEDTQKRKMYMPQFRPQLFYGWSAALILGPVLAQCVVYAVLCFGFGMCLTSAIPWIMVALIIFPAVFLLRWMLRGIMREEMNDVLKTIEDGGAVRSIHRAKIKAFYLFPGKVFWISMSLMVVLLLPVSLFSLRFIGGSAFFNLLFVPMACYMMLSVIYSVEANKAMERISRFFPALTTPRKITGTLSSSLTMKTLLILAGFAVSACCLMLISSHNDPVKGRMAGLSLLTCAVIIMICLAAVWYFGRVTGQNLKKISKAFNALYRKTDREKKIRDLSLAVPAGISASDVKALLEHSKDLLQGILGMREMKKIALDGLMQNQKIKTLFIASMSHDLKSPLNSIIGFSELLLKGIEGELNEEQKEDIRLIHDAGEELLNIINNVLDFSRLEAGTLEIHKEWTPSVELITGAVKTGSHLIGGKSITIQTEIQAGMPPVYVDPQRISQILTCLISNAVKFMEKGSITIKVHVTRGLNEDNDKYLKIDVLDTGMGIKRTDLEKIFDSFRQVDSSFSRRSSGLGLGLSLSKALVELHGGKIWVESEMGSGSIFSVGIPMEPVT